MNKANDKTYLNHIKDVLRSYYYLKDTYNMLLVENNELNNKIDLATRPTGISYDREPSGVSTVRPTPYINELIVTQASIESELYSIERKIKHLEKDYKIKEMLGSLDEDEKGYFTMLYENRLSTGAIAKLKGCSQQNVHKHCDYILKKMITYGESIL